MTIQKQLIPSKEYPGWYEWIGWAGDPDYMRPFVGQVYRIERGGVQQVFMVTHVKERVTDLEYMGMVIDCFVRVDFDWYLTGVAPDLGESKQTVHPSYVRVEQEA